MIDDEYSWACPKCHEILRAAGPATLNFIRTNHEYLHLRETKGFANGGYVGNPKPVSLRCTHGLIHGQCSYCRPPAPVDALVNGIAALDDAFFDGARLTDDDHKFLRSLKVCWNQPPEQARFQLNP